MSDDRKVFICVPVADEPENILKQSKKDKCDICIQEIYVSPSTEKYAVAFEGMSILICIDCMPKFLEGKPNIIFQPPTHEQLAEMEQKRIGDGWL